MGAVAGLMLGLGLLAAWSSTWPPTQSPRAGRLRTSWDDLAARAGLHTVGLGPFAAVCVGVSVVVFVVALGLGMAISVALAFALIALGAPMAYVHHRSQRRRVELRTLWPDVVDDLTSAVRAGLTLPEAMVAMAERGPWNCAPTWPTSRRSTGQRAASPRP